MENAPKEVYLRMIERYGIAYIDDVIAAVGENRVVIHESGRLIVIVQQVQLFVPDYNELDMIVGCLCMN